MVSPTWKRIAGAHILDDGTAAVVWMARDPDNDVVHVYDACVFRREVLAIIAEGLNARGRGIPVAWIDQGFADKLLERGCNMLPEPADDTDSMRELISRDIWERMRTGRFKVDRRLKEWTDEYKTYDRDGENVPRETHPMMAATRYAISKLEFARAEQSHAQRRLYPSIAMI